MFRPEGALVEGAAVGEVDMNVDEARDRRRAAGASTTSRALRFAEIRRAAHREDALTLDQDGRILEAAAPRFRRPAVPTLQQDPHSDMPFSRSSTTRSQARTCRSLRPLAS